MSDPKHVRDRVFAQLSASGAADPERNDVAAVLERVRKSPPPNVHLAATSECYAAGCATEVRIGKAAFHKAQSALVAAVKGYWDGPVFVSGPVPDAGDTISCSLVVYSKDRG